MEPIKRFTNSIQEGNLWIYILALGKEIEIKEEDVKGLIFEKFGFLPGSLMIKAILFRLKNEGYVSRERFASKKAYKTTQKGIEQLEKMQSIVSETMEKLC
ncbi:MAG: hypothetical protein PHI91_01285 [Candidatus Pacebacteria bacterium]|jgi:DNA-binding transcriptional regulator PaaX|nr:hypothetical protein [Candidatus Paceibacterota bacterium]MDD2757088.1 hypothetical protein [Candidatus Paceibacterota bacterium]MDD3283708.1 hypothetical protein [Candidatus Paceibacterota bacterium]MDD3969817.1 hypothetical protein [Candidatus Paceibacterota bacterium]MDD4737771.1 hypothetical protein [Candidatus Paceibacterota bacterium]